jgi:peptidoglycan hydrolase-like amidase
LLAEAVLHIGAPEDAEDPILRRITNIPPRVTPAPYAPEEGIMRIGLNVNRRLVSVKSGGAFSIVNALSGEVLHSGNGREQFWVRQDSNGALVIFDENDTVLISSDVPLIYRLDSNQDTSIVVGIVGGSPGASRIYRGELEFIAVPEAAGFTVVNIVTMGDYLLGAVPAEMPASWPMEALHAQTITMRSYAMAYRGRFAHRGFDIWGDARSQAYGGVGIEHPRSTAAVIATTGLILVGESGQTLAAYYSANHGGHSEDSIVMWGADAYMRAVQDLLLPPRPTPLLPDALFRWLRDVPETYSNVPGLFFANTYRWERWITPEEIRRRLMLDGRVRQDPGEIHRIVSRGRGISGRIFELEVQGSYANVRVRSDAVWFTMGGLRSSLFSIRAKQEPDGSVRHFIFQGAGYGHGMGMDQHAAAGKASRGFTAEQILYHFYPRASLRQLTGLDN